MTVSFSPDPGFFTKIGCNQADAPLYKAYGGQSSQCFMLGEDGNLYYPLFPFYVGASTDAEAIGCAQTGNVIVLSISRLAADGAISGSRSYALIPCNGTKYFWVIGIDSSPRVTWFYSGVMYKIVNDTTVEKVGGFPQFETKGLLHDSGPFYGGLFGDQGIYSIQMSPDFKTVYFVAKLATYGGTGSSRPVGISSLTVVEGGGTMSPWIVDYPLLTDDFFNYAANTFNYQALTLVPDHSDLGWHYLLTINQNAYNYMQAHLSDSTSYALFTRPGVYMWRPDTGALTDVSDAFGITDWGKHLDGTASTNLKDDYCGCSSFVFDDQSFVIFSKSYSSTADLNTTGLGTYIHIQIFQWDTEVATKVIDTHLDLFDVTDAGGSAGGTYPPNFVQTGLVNDSIYYLWGNGPMPSTDSYVVGSLYHLTAPGKYHAYFAEFRNPDYMDWYTAGGADFDSELFTSFYLSSLNSLFMEAPWVISYLDNTTDYVVNNTDAQIVDEDGNAIYVMPSLLLTPRWEWTDSQSNHKSGPTLDVYQLRLKSNVSDKRTRVRGKGRALQLHWKSSPRKPFNLLGWSVVVDENASY